MADLAPFAIVNDLEAQLGGVWDERRRTQATEALRQASDYLRDVVGRPITRVRSLVAGRAGDGGVLPVPGPVAEVHALTTVAGAPVAHEVEDAFTLRVQAARGTRVRVDLTHGWDPIPGELRRWALVLAASQLASLKRGSLGMGGNIAYVSVDDARVGFTQGGETAGGLELPPRVASRLRATYGGDTAGVVLEHR